jgi:hypothetical protein
MGIWGLMVKFFTIFQLKKKLFLILKKIAVSFSLGLHERRPSYRRSLQSSKEEIQHFKTWNFPHFFLLLWIIIFDLLDLDPADQAKADQCGTASTTLVKGSVPDP